MVLNGATVDALSLGAMAHDLVSIETIAKQICRQIHFTEGEPDVAWVGSNRCDCFEVRNAIHELVHMALESDLGGLNVEHVEAAKEIIGAWAARLVVHPKLAVIAHLSCLVEMCRIEADHSDMYSCVRFFADHTSFVERGLSACLLRAIDDRLVYERAAVLLREVCGRASENERP